MLNEDENEIEQGAALPPCDADKYKSEIGDLDLTDEQAAEFLRNLDFILRSFVDLGWGVDSVQNFIPGLKEFSSCLDSGEIQQDIPTPKFNNAALPQAERDDSNAG